MSTPQLLLFLIGTLSAIAILTTYVVYPLLIALYARFFPRRWKTDENALPPVTMLVAAYNEAEVLEEKIRNFLAMDYPPDRLRLLIGSDGSTDGTQELLDRLCDGERVRYFAFGRGGKMKTVNQLATQVTTPYIIFSDANTMYHPQAARKLLRHFADDSIGGVCGKLVLRPVNESSGGRGEHTYWSFENLIKQWEGNAATTLGATGGIYAIRTEFFEPQPEEGYVADDFLLPMRILLRGKRFVFDGEALATEDTMPDMRREYHRKIRVAISTFNAMRELRPRLHELPFSVRLMLFGHKTLRWLVPFFLVAILLSAALLASLPWVWNWVLIPSVIFSVLALLAYVAESFGKRLGVLSLPLYFISINVALLVGWWKFLSGAKASTWERSPRS
ncbi:MAG: glycosyltransferase family 2 protein [Bacteroidia bacterium]|nr:glycosyltransferase family 2 protein [Bacteroidia bacterium]